MSQVPVPAVEQVVKLGTGVAIDGYMIACQGEWEFRYGLEYIALLMGYSKNYYQRLTGLRVTEKRPKKLEALLSKGYSGYKIPVKVLRDGKRGASVIETISFDDLCCIVEHEAEIKNSRAIALLTASFRELLRSRTQAAFDLPQDTLEQSQESFEHDYYDYLERQACLAEDREDLEGLFLPGDEDCYPQYRDWDDIQPWRRTRRKSA